MNVVAGTHATNELAEAIATCPYFFPVDQFSGFASSVSHDHGACWTVSLSGWMGVLSSLLLFPGNPSRDTFSMLIADIFSALIHWYYEMVLTRTSSKLEV